MVAVWDQRTQDHSAGIEFGAFVLPPGADDAHVMRGSTLAEPTGRLGERSSPICPITVSMSPVADNLLDPLLIASGLRLHAFP